MTFLLLSFPSPRSPPLLWSCHEAYVSVSRPDAPGDCPWKISLATPFREERVPRHVILHIGSIPNVCANFFDTHTLVTAPGCNADGWYVAKEQHSRMRPHYRPTRGGTTPLLCMNTEQQTPSCTCARRASNSTQKSTIRPAFSVACEAVRSNQPAAHTWEATYTAC